MWNSVKPDRVITGVLFEVIVPLTSIIRYDADQRVMWQIFLFTFTVEFLYYYLQLFAFSGLFNNPDQVDKCPTVK